MVKNDTGGGEVYEVTSGSGRCEDTVQTKG